MKNVKILWTIIALLLVFSGFLVNKFISGNVAPSEDGRTSVVLTKDERNLVLDEMRAFLVSVQGVSQAITENNMDKLAELAHKAGMAAEQSTPGSLLQKIPLGMKKLGFGTREKFDEIAETATSTKDAITARKQLDTLMQNCIACHTLYRLPEPQD
jgi:mono/diheme cytochrome c family protein